MKRFVILVQVLLVLFVVSCKQVSSDTDNKVKLNKKNGEKISLSEFKKIDHEKQAEYINSLDKKTRMKFFVSFLPGSVLEVELYTEAKFFDNGRIIILEETDGPRNIYATSYWKYDNGKIIITSKSNDSSFPNGVKEIWTDIHAEKYNPKHLYIKVTVNKGSMKSRLLRYLPGGSDSINIYEERIKELQNKK